MFYQVMAAVIQYGLILYRMHLGKSKGVGVTMKKEMSKTTIMNWNNNRLDRTSFVLFPIFSFLLAAAYWIYHLKP